MSNAGWASEVSQYLRSTFREQAQDVGAEVAADIKAAISTPVEYDGSKVIRSRPGEPPRKESGDLLDSIDFAVEQFDGTEQLSVYSDSKILGYLDGGTSTIEPRPVFGPAFERWAGPAADRLGAPK